MKANKNSGSTLAGTSLEEALDRIFLFDLRNAIAHELGHYLVTLALGG